MADCRALLNQETVNKVSELSISQKSLYVNTKEVKMGNYKDLFFRLTVLLVLMLTLGLLLIAAETWERWKGETLDLPDAESLHLMYYIPDRNKPYEQIWLGGDEAAEVLEKLEKVRLCELDTAPEDVRDCVGLLVLSFAPEERWIEVHIRDGQVVYLREEGRWYRHDRAIEKKTATMETGAEAACCPYRRTEGLDGKESANA